MAILFDAPVNPDDITTFIRQVPQQGTNYLSAEIPTVFDDSIYIDWDTILEVSRTAQFRAYDGSIHVSERDSGTDNRVKMLPISDSLSVGEYERLQQEFTRLQGANTQALAKAVYNDSEKLTRYVQNRIELAWGDLLTDGILTINENGYQGSADFGVPASQKVTAGTSWSNTAAATPLSDMLSWVDVFWNNNGYTPEVTRVTRVTLRNLLANTQIINATYGAQTQKTRAELPDVNVMLAGQGVPPVQLQNVRRLSVDVNGSYTPTSVLADNTVLFTPASLGDICTMHWGLSATALELVNSTDSDLTFEEAPGIVGVIEKSGPPYRQYTFVDAVGMPVLSNPYGLLTASV